MSRVYLGTYGILPLAGCCCYLHQWMLVTQENRNRDTLAPLCRCFSTLTQQPILGNVPITGLGTYAVGTYLA